ncbi:hypothetical protein [Vibrio alfacsensis]|uniref:hypothetical protein n=1 Tax=Vibrio alfacsensis TaxID=1074311 RepID=UPI004067915B
MEIQNSAILRSIKLLSMAMMCWFLSSAFWNLNNLLSEVFEIDWLFLSLIDGLLDIAALVFLFLVVITSNKGLFQIDSQSENSVRMRENKQSAVGGIALSCIISIAVVIALAARNDDLLLSGAIWFLYTVFAGLAINTYIDTPISKVVLYSVFPSLTFFIGAMSLLGFIYLLGAGSAISAGVGTSSGSVDHFQKLTMVYILMSILSVPAISFASLARTKLIDLYGKSKLITVEELESLQKKINIFSAIVVFVLGAILSI